MKQLQLTKFVCPLNLKAEAIYLPSISGETGNFVTLAIYQNSLGFVHSLSNDASKRDIEKRILVKA